MRAPTSLHRLVSDSQTRTASAQTASAAGAGQRPVAKLPARTDLASLLALKLDIDFVLPGLVRGTVGALVSPGGVGKSYWTLEVALAIACTVKVGSTFERLDRKINLTNLRPEQGRVVLFAAEDAQQIVASRVQAVLGDAQIDGRNFDYRDCVGLNVDIMLEDWFAQLLEASRGARLVILDTLSRFHQLDENSTHDAKKLMAQLERLAAESGAAVLYVHHTSKVAAMSGAGAMQQAARGSSVLVDNARWAAFLAPMTEQEARQFDIEGSAAEYVRWNISKQNYVAPREDVWFRRRHDGVLQAVHMRKRVRPAAPAESTVPAPADTPAAVLEQVTPEPSASPLVLVPSANNVNGGNW